ncbi:MAG: hypothetical protein ACREDL_06945 [Bradyrhizobium sp.]
MPDPLGWHSFREDLKERFDRIAISYKPAHSASRKLHEETADGIHPTSGPRGTRDLRLPQAVRRQW